jgi:hypothetical protein
MLTIKAYQKNQKKIAKVNALLGTANYYAAKTSELVEAMEGIIEETWKHIFSTDNKLVADALFTTAKTKKELIDLIPKAEQYNLTIANDDIKKGMFDILWRNKKELLTATISPQYAKIINKKIISPYNLEKILLVKITITATQKALCVAKCLFNDGNEVVLGFEDIVPNMIKEQITKELGNALKKMIAILRKDIKKNEKLVEKLRKELEPYIVLCKI